jgi:hypothetical protein
MAFADKKDVYPLAWPDGGWPRTRPQDQKANASWRRTANQYRDMLAKELARMGAPSVLISCNVPLNQRGQLAPGPEPRDVGVAVYFSRKKVEDFSWQETLELSKVMYPTEAEVDAQFRRLAAPYHPDRGGDITMFQKFATARDQAKRWINRSEHQSFDYVIACDTFREVRLNIAALVTSIRAIRALERVGTSAILERAFKGFSALPAGTPEAMAR